MIPPVNPDLLTETDKFALSKMPSGRWFDSYFLSPAIRRPHYRCDRLHQLGYLEYKVIGEWPNLESRYRKKRIAKKRRDEFNVGIYIDQD